MKVRFDWLTRTQAQLAFRRFFDLAAPPTLDLLATLTPADFALVRRRAAMAGATEASEIVRLLAAECEGRSGRRQRMGFVGGRGGSL